MERKESSQTIRAIFEQYGRKRFFQPGQQLLEKGAPATQLWYIINGTIRALCTNKDGDILTLFYIQAEDIVYAESLAPNMKVLNDAEAVTQLEVLTLQTEEFLKLWWAEDGSKEELFSHLVRRIILYQNLLCCSQQRTGKQKVAYLFYSHYLQSGTSFFYSQDQIADITGITRGSVNRILTEFTQEGIISRGYKKIEILAPDKLPEFFNSLGYLL